MTSAGVGRNDPPSGLLGEAEARGDPDGQHGGEVADQLADIYHRHGAAVYGLVRKLAGPAAGEPVTVDAFVALGRTPHALRGGAAPAGSSVLVLAHRQAVYVLRSDPDRRARLATMTPTQVERTSWEQTGARARDLLSQLSADERRSVVLAYFGGHDCREISAILGQPEDTVKTHLRTALHRLRKEMDAARGTSARRSAGSS